jgi:hypothetical protein
VSDDTKATQETRDRLNAITPPFIWEKINAGKAAQAEAAAASEAPAADTSGQTDTSANAPTDASANAPADTSAGTTETP